MTNMVVLMKIVHQIVNLQGGPSLVINNNAPLLIPFVGPLLLDKLGFTILWTELRNSGFFNLRSQVQKGFLERIIQHPFFPDKILC